MCLQVDEDGTMWPGLPTLVHGSSTDDPVRFIAAQRARPDKPPASVPHNSGVGAEVSAMDVDGVTAAGVGGGDDDVEGDPRNR